jgi:hypothetical protein
MKQTFGGKPAGFYLRWTPWIAESHKKGHAVVTLAIVQIQRLTL